MQSRNWGRNNSRGERIDEQRSLFDADTGGMTCRRLGAYQAADITIYCHGVCKGNPGRGAWAFVLVDGQQRVLEAAGTEVTTTSVAIVLVAVLQALQRVPQQASVRIVTCVGCVANSLHQRGNWSYMYSEKDRMNMANGDLWAKIVELLQQHPFRAEWVAKDESTELQECHRLANEQCHPPDDFWHQR